MNLPPNVKNTRFLTDNFAKHRPALTFTGFDNQGDNAHGLGIKQVIERAEDNKSLENFIIRNLVSRAAAEMWPRQRADQPNVSRTHVVNHNSSIVQARAFAALFSLVLTQNKMLLPNVKFLSPQKAVEELMECFKADPGTFPLFANEIESGQDRVKWTKSLMNMSRAIDLYLALENAVQHYEGDESVLLSEADKEALLIRLEKGIGEVLDIVDSEFGIGSYISGNWSLKMWVSAAYACLCSQKTSKTNQKLLGEWFGRGLRRAAPGNLKDKRHYWTYMTTREVGETFQDGQRTWAEGPYYMHFALQDTIPFWHAMRAQGFLRHKPFRVNISDPFNSEWFINPLEWLADIATPEGGTPPFDDGNRKEMTYVHMMTWDGEYGDEKVAQKMNTIYRTLTGAGDDGIPKHLNHIDTDVLLVQLVMPKTMGVTPLAPEIGNKAPLDLQDEQLIVRREAKGHTHYIALHGEGSSDTIQRGEGHEQPDQLQLLYYIGDHSLIMDAGYDRGHVIKNSSWNRYTDHNVMAFDDGDSGMKAPHRTLKKVSHTTVDYLYFDEFTRDTLAVMKGHTVLKWRKSKRLFRKGHKHETNGHYGRTLLFVNDGEAPYLIDVNQVRNERKRGSSPGLQMRYHVDAAASHGRDAWYDWGITDELTCSLYFQGVEFDKSKGRVVFDDQEVRERFGKNETIKRLTYFGPKAGAMTTVGVFSAIPDLSKTAPEPQVPYTGSKALTHQIWRWENVSKDTIDVIFVRSQIDEERYEDVVEFEIKLPADSVKFVCRSRQDVGFARCQIVNGKWEVLEDYLYGLDVLRDMIA